jgi:hypothetical protein
MMSRETSTIESAAEGLFDVNASVDPTQGAIDLIAKLAVLIVTGLLFAGYGIREGRTQGLQTPGAQVAAQSKAERASELRRVPADRRHAPSPQSPRALPLSDHFGSSVSDRP